MHIQSVFNLTVSPVFNKCIQNSSICLRLYITSLYKVDLKGVSLISESKGAKIWLAVNYLCSRRNWITTRKYTDLERHLLRIRHLCHRIHRSRNRPVRCVWTLDYPGKVGSALRQVPLSHYVSSRLIISLWSLFPS